MCVCSDVKENADTARESVKDLFEKLIRTVYDRKSVLMEKIDSVRDSKLSVLEQQLVEATNMEDRIAEQKQEIKKALTSRDIFETVINSAFISPIKKLLANFPNFDPKVTSDIEFNPIVEQYPEINLDEILSSIGNISNHGTSMNVEFILPEFTVEVTICCQTDQTK